MGNGASSWRSGFHRRHSRAVLRLQNEYLPQRSLAALPTHGDVDPGQAQHHLFSGFRLTRFGGRLMKQASAEGELAGPAAIGEQSVVTQPGKATRQHMQQEAANELVGVEAHHLDPVAVGVVAPPEANVLAVEVDEAMVADGDLVGVAPEIGQHLPGAGERGLAVEHPVVRSQRRLQTLEPVAVVAAAVQAKLAVTVRSAEEVEILAAEDLGERGRGEQEALAGVSQRCPSGLRPPSVTMQCTWMCCPRFCPQVCSTMVIPISPPSQRDCGRTPAGSGRSP